MGGAGAAAAATAAAAPVAAAAAARRRAGGRARATCRVALQLIAAADGACTSWEEGLALVLCWMPAPQSAAMQQPCLPHPALLGCNW